MKAFFNNLKFRSKMILIFGITFFFSEVLSGIAFYQYTSRDVEENYKISAENVLSQMTDTLDMRLLVIRQRSHGLLTNNTFVTGMSDYLNQPSDLNIVKTMGMVSTFLKDLEMGERLIHSCYIYTDKGEFDNFVKMRDWQFVFEESDYYHIYHEQPGYAIRWLPVRENDIFTDRDNVVPYVRKFSVYNYDGDLYLVILLKQKELEQMLAGNYEFFDELLIIDHSGNIIAGSAGLDVNELIALKQSQNEDGVILTSDYRYQGNTYMVMSDEIAENGWQIYGLKSRETLLGSLKNLRNVIIQMIVAVFAIGAIAILLLSHRLTSSLRRLETRMQFIKNGDFKVRFFYPYRDEVGELAQGFNYMIDEIQHLIEKQEETIEELKWERDYVAQIQMQKRKAELKALQAQINPHFLYNTLNAITWQAADQGAEEISILSNALGKFFRISLSKGAEVITLKEELEHVSSYLDIQSIRYQNLLSYEIDGMEAWLGSSVIKLILQPLVENSIYHGIKEKPGGGKIRIWAEPGDDEETDLRLVVWDDGVGIEAEKIAVLNGALKRGETDRSEGYGIYNVNERLRLYYGDTYGLRFESQAGAWTKAILTLSTRKGGWRDVSGDDC